VPEVDPSQMSVPVTALGSASALSLWRVTCTTGAAPPSSDLYDRYGSWHPHCAGLTSMSSAMLVDTSPA